MTPKPKPAPRSKLRDLPPDWFCEGQQDLLDQLREPGDEPPEEKETT